MTISIFRKVIAVASLCMILSPAQAEVTNAAANGFTSVNSVVVAGDRFAAFGTMVNDVGQWWNGDHTMSGIASNMFIEARALGCFCERLPNDGMVLHMTVTFVNPGVILRLTGGLGPLGLMGVNGNMTWEFSEHADGTMIKLSYAVGGYMDGGLDSIAPAVDGVLREQLQGLQAHIDAKSAD